MRKNKKILIIDDEAYIRRVIELKLKRRGYQVFTASDGAEGLKEFKKHEPDVVITDVMMPEIDGREFCEQTNAVKKDRPFLTIVISCSLPEHRSEWLTKMDETLFFEKPFSPSRLLDRIDQYFSVQK